ncbi:hypothetical protein DHEL01_v211864 [Diaporthe helianthi]|uniref:Uncharacterized protein n=1 Tax=Diaporthe helianthi TaxID=158607 RepID=A0A2P5HHL6_DIAHE|nr:hypothetical protein DHEL01_v211864 [Diaporthe helianthi]
MQYSKRAILALAVLGPAFTSSLALPQVALRDTNAVSVQDAHLTARNLHGAMPVKLGSRQRGGGAPGEEEDEAGGEDGEGGKGGKGGDEGGKGGEGGEEEEAA